jgi:hypothetical protein
MSDKNAVKLLETLNNGGKVSSRVHQKTIQTAVDNGWIAWDESKGWTITNAGYLRYLRS